MRRLLLLAVLTACVAAPHGAPLPSFTAMSFNIRYGSANDGQDAWPRRRDDLAALVVAQAPEILGVQEALGFQLEFLAERLPHHTRLGQGRDGGDRGEYAALFVDRRRFVVLESGDFWLSPTPEVPASVGWDAALTRICTFAHLRDLRSERSLWVWNTHFDHQGARARAKSAALLGERLRAEPGPHLVLGDFNAGENSAPLDTLRDCGLRDTFRDVAPDASEVGTFHAFRGGRRGAKIDYVMVDRGLATEHAEILDQPGARGRWPSDHHAVIARLRHTADGPQ